MAYKDTFFQPISATDIFRHLLSIKWKIFKTSILASLIFISIAAVVAFKFKAVGYIDLYGVKRDNYIYFSSFFVNSDVLFNFNAKDEYDKKLIAKLSRQIASGAATFATETIKPISSLEDLNADTSFPMKLATPNQKKESEFIYSLRIQTEGRTPLEAERNTQLMGLAVKNAIIYSMLIDFIQKKLIKAKSTEQELEMQLLESEVELGDQYAVMNDLKKIDEKYSKSTDLNPAQVVVLKEGGQRFLPPKTQLIGLESLIAEKRRAMESKKRKLDVVKIDSEIAQRVLPHIQTYNADKLLKIFTDAFQAVFALHDLSNDNINMSKMYYVSFIDKVCEVRDTVGLKGKINSNWESAVFFFIKLIAFILLFSLVLSSLLCTYIYRPRRTQC